LRVGDLEPTVLRQRLAEGHFFVRSGPFVFAIKTAHRPLADTFGLLYRDFRLLDDETYADFHVCITKRHGLLTWLTGELGLVVDAIAPFGRFSAHTAPSYTEWGLNWCIHPNVKRFLLTHAATVEKDGEAAVIVGDSGQGKSTLCAALVATGWRLLSDEFALIDSDGMLRAMPRPISLKNESIDVIREFAGDFEFGPVMTGTVKGTVAHVRPPRDCVDAAKVRARPAWLVFPQYRQAASLETADVTSAHAFMKTAKLSFNYNVLGRSGFELLDKVVSGCECWSLSYGVLSEAVEEFGRRHTTNIGVAQGKAAST